MVRMRGFSIGVGQDPRRGSKSAGMLGKRRRPAIFA